MYKEIWEGEWERERERAMRHKTVSSFLKFRLRRQEDRRYVDYITQFLRF
jgi:hypothetical protein